MARKAWLSVQKSWWARTEGGGSARILTPGIDIFSRMMTEYTWLRSVRYTCNASESG